MHVALYSDTFEPQINGVAVVVETIGHELVRQGHRVTVCTVSAPGHHVTLPRRLKKEPYRVIRYASASLPTYKEQRATVATILGSTWWIEQDKPDVIHAHDPFALGLEAIGVSKVFRRPLVWTAHTFLKDYVKHLRLLAPLGRMLAEHYEPWIYNRGRLVTCPSEALAQDLKRRGLKRPVILLENPVDIDRFAQAAALRSSGRERYGLKSQTLLYFGRLSYEKNLHELLDAVTPVLLQHQDFRMLVVGEGPERSALERHAKARSVADQIIFTGILRGEALVEAVSAADVFVTASLTENQPISLIEAQAAGLPVVAYAARGIPEIIADGKTGFLLKPGETVQFGEALEKILASPALRLELGEQSKKAMQRFQVRTVVSRLTNIYEQCG